MLAGDAKFLMNYQNMECRMFCKFCLTHVSYNFLPGEDFEIYPDCVCKPSRLDSKSLVEWPKEILRIYLFDNKCILLLSIRMSLGLFS
jgi:hypothetical protein